MATHELIADGAPLPGTLISEKYRVVGVIGRGGMGCLVKAEHLLLKKDVAIKFVLADRSDAARRRLFREARAAQSLSCEQVVRVFDLGVHEGAPFIVMELLEGSDLSVRVSDEGPLAVDEAVDCLLEACVAVDEAHARGIVHRDIKPGNLFAARTATREVVKVLDFGISKVPEPAGAEDCEQTAAGTMLGTPYYTSPEQLRNPANIDGRTDVWALGVTLFHLLSGEHPFPGANAREVTATIFSDPPRALLELRPEVPQDLWRVVLATLAKRPEERTPSVAALVKELLPFASKRGQRAAEQVLGAELPSAISRPPPLRDAQSSSLSTTDAGVSSTLSTGDGVSEEPSAPALATGTARRRVLVAVASVAMGLAGLSWLTREPPGTGATPVRPVTPAAVNAPGEAELGPDRPTDPLEAPSRPNAEPNAQPNAQGDDGSIPSEGAFQRPAASSAASAASPLSPAPGVGLLKPVAMVSPPAHAPPATATPLPSAAPPANDKPRDIDGVPIVD